MKLATKLVLVRFRKNGFNLFVWNVVLFISAVVVLKPRLTSSHAIGKPFWANTIAADLVNAITGRTLFMISGRGRAVQRGGRKTPIPLDDTAQPQKLAPRYCTWPMRMTVAPSYAFRLSARF
jgi:hypothetical protein